ncbi:flavin reductase family protein [Streptosporangium saharense]|uniref:Flavin reductase (DIM6/NTAB) family NADH-FMN oxidoreductase RutF n=1 Tax=Streptosporangium saharense TaxID=1706840 RepID=A0A7W7VKK7_9ACTN|nr:flavin reductase family protein [Streptosporangium saharense]MBB4913439.1 flavin reductase (DIM6/NTAB) family NADH-FMN oxidoreductase RutF [Streptosporangium saharense]
MTTAMTPTPVVDPLTMRRTMGRFATGVAVVTTVADGVPHGMTVNSLTSVSLEPPLLLVCLTTGARSTDAVTRAGRFAISILSVRQEQLALRFARRGEDHFAGLDVTYGRHAVPVIPDAFAHLECEVERHFVAGDHVVVIGHVLTVCERDGEPLGFMGGRFSDIVDRGHDPVSWFF